MIIVRFTTFITVFSLSCYGWAGPSFNCSKATTKIEHAICGANMLSEYDNLMGKMYRELKNISEVKKSQRDWIKKRNTQCLSADVDCLADLYQTRLLELDKYYSPSDKNGEYVMTGGDREITVTLSSSNNLIQVKLFGGGGKDSTCDFDGTGQLNGDEAVVRNHELSEDAFMKITFHNQLIDISTQGFGFCGVYGYAGGLYLLTNKQKNKSHQKELTSTSQPPRTKIEPAQNFDCSPRKNCSTMVSCEEAYYHLNTCGNGRLDRDKDGIPCESLCN